MICCHDVLRAIVILIVVGAALRLAGVFDDFWLDEIWSLRIAQGMRSVSDLLMSPAARWDNNHPLITLVMYLTGERSAWWIWRIPSLLGGTGSLVLAAVLLQRWDRAAALLGTATFALSYPLILYSSEARGYALAVFFALLALNAMDRCLRHTSAAATLVFITACLLGILSHLTFVHAYAGILVWSAHRLGFRGKGPSTLLKLHAAPIGFFVLVYLSFARHLSIGGAPEQRPASAVLESIGQLLGLSRGAGAMAAGILGLALLGVCIVALARRGCDFWIVVLVAAVISPALLLARQFVFAATRQPIAPRYLLVSYSIALLAAAMAMAPALRRGGSWRWITSALVLGLAATNLVQTARFLRTGRGHYADAVVYMSQRDPSPTIRVLSDHRLRTEMVLDFYSRRMLPPDRKLVAYDADEFPPPPRPLGPPMWIIVHSDKRGEIPGEFPGFVFDREFGYFGLSGYSWYLYRSRDVP